MLYVRLYDMVSAQIVRDGSEIKLPGLFEVEDLNPSVLTTENLVGVVFTGDVLMFDDGTSSTYYRSECWPWSQSRGFDQN